MSDVFFAGRVLEFAFSVFLVDFEVPNVGEVRFEQLKRAIILGVVLIIGELQIAYEFAHSG
jgi:hypothetical protein